MNEDPVYLNVSSKHLIDKFQGYQKSAVAMSLVLPPPTLFWLGLQFRAFTLLESSLHLTKRDLSKNLGVILDGVSDCSNALVAKCSVNMQNFKNKKNKWVYVYLLIPQGISEKADLTGAFLNA